jgi:hypothetical protein
VPGNLNSKERRLKVQIRLIKGTGVILVFPQSELRVALGILKAVHKVTNADFILEAINDIENELKPPQLPFTLSTRICEKCFCEVDIKTDNAIHYTGDQDKWIHRTCPVLKDNRPV